MSHDWMLLSEGSKTRRRLQRLFDIRTEEVSVVDRAANGRRFLTVKREASMGKQTDNAAATAERETFDFDDVDPAVDFGSDPVEIRAGVEKGAALQPIVKYALTETLSEGIERLLKVHSAIQGATIVTEKQQLPAAFGQEFRAVNALFGGLTAQFAKSDTGAEEVEAEKAKGKAEDGECPDGQKMVDGKCVPNFVKKFDLKPEAKNAVTEALTGVIKRAMAARDLVRTAKSSTEGDEMLPDSVGREIRSLAHSLGSILAAFPAQTQKGFGLVDLDGNPSRLAKASGTLKLDAETQSTVAKSLDATLDALTSVLVAVEEAPTDDAMAQTLPADMAESLAKGTESIDCLCKDFVAKDEGADPEEEPPAAESEGEGEEEAATAADESTDEKPAEGAADAEATTDNASDAPAAEGAGEGGETPEPTEKGQNAMDPETLGKLMESAVEKALAKQKEAHAAELGVLKQTLKEQGMLVEKMASATPESNVEPPGQTEDDAPKQDEDFGDGWGKPAYDTDEAGDDTFFG
jgi:hypothetical protein